jgi:hypothetical protein
MTPVNLMSNDKETRSLKGASIQAKVQTFPLQLTAQDQTSKQSVYVLKYGSGKEFARELNRYHIVKRERGDISH